MQHGPGGSEHDGPVARARDLGVDDEAVSVSLAWGPQQAHERTRGRVGPCAIAHRHDQLVAVPCDGYGHAVRASVVGHGEEIRRRSEVGDRLAEAHKRDRDAHVPMLRRDRRCVRRYGPVGALLRWTQIGRVAGPKCGASSRQTRHRGSFDGGQIANPASRDGSGSAALC
jgi:hypothetical protein